MKKQILLFLVIFSATTSMFAQFKMAELNYSYGALEPYIDSTTMYIHYNNHYANYVNNLNNSLAKSPELKNKDIKYLLRHLNEIPANIQTSVRNNGGGFYNHTLYFSMLAPAGTAPISDKFMQVLVDNFGSFTEFKAAFEKEANGRFGSGWVWLLKDKKGNLKIITTPNQDCPLMFFSEANVKVILACDLWEHAYYLKYQSKKADYFKAFWNVVNWEEVESLYKK